MVNPNNRQIAIPALEFNGYTIPKSYVEHLRCIGIPEVEIKKILVCGVFTHVDGDFDNCKCEPQIVREYCNSSFCPRCADKQRKRLASDMVSYYRKVYETAGIPLRLARGELTVEDLLWEKITDVDLARKAAEKTLYEFFGYDRSRFELGIELNCDIWGEKHITRGFQPHVHFVVCSLVYDRVEKRLIESPVIGNYKTHAELARLRELWRKNLCEVFGLKPSAPHWDVKYGFISEKVVGAKVAYAMLAQRLLYMYRKPIVDVAKYLATAITSKKFPLNYNYAWLGRLLNFYSDTKKRGDKRRKHFVRFGWISDRLQKRMGNLLCKQLNKFPDFKSPSERRAASRKPRCVYHRMSFGRLLSPRGLTIEAALAMFPKARIVGMVRERRLGEFWKEAGSVSQRLPVVDEAVRADAERERIREMARARGLL